MTYTIDMLIDKIKEVGKSYDLDKIQAAYELAEKAHDGVFRSSGRALYYAPCSSSIYTCRTVLHGYRYNMRRSPA